MSISFITLVKPDYNRYSGIFFVTAKVRVRQKTVSFQSVGGLSEYSGPEYLDKPPTRPEAVFFLTFWLGNNHDKNRPGQNHFCLSPIFVIIDSIFHEK